MKVVAIVGARPQFVKLAAVSPELRRAHQEIVVHTGQHYDYEMSELFFQELAIPKPDYNLQIGSRSHGRQTGEMLARIEDVLLAEKPDIVLVFGDTNTTVAGALAAAKLHIPVGHVEAGLRSYNKELPEEINRRLTDHCSDLLFSPTQTAVDNLRREGIEAGVHMVGDVMYDIALRCQALRTGRALLANLGVEPGGYLLLTVHRPGNTDNVANLAAIMEAVEMTGEAAVFPVHPRTQDAVKRLGRTPSTRLKLIPPVGYLDMMALEQNARKILTDSGGVQKEAYFFGVPCVTLRDETEWPETIGAGWNVLVGTDKERILDAVRNFQPNGSRPPVFGDGNATRRIVEVLGGTS